MECVCVRVCVCTYWVVCRMKNLGSSCKLNALRLLRKKLDLGQPTATNTTGQCLDTMTENTLKCACACAQYYLANKWRIPLLPSGLFSFGIASSSGKKKKQTVCYICVFCQLMCEGKSTRNVGIATHTHTHTENEANEKKNAMPNEIQVFIKQ